MYLHTINTYTMYYSTELNAKSFSLCFRKFTSFSQLTSAASEYAEHIQLMYLLQGSFLSFQKEKVFNTCICTCTCSYCTMF